MWSPMWSPMWGWSSRLGDQDLCWDQLPAPRPPKNVGFWFRQILVQLNGATYCLCDTTQVIWQFLTTLVCFPVSWEGHGLGRAVLWRWRKHVQRTGLSAWWATRKGRIGTASLPPASTGHLVAALGPKMELFRSTDEMSTPHCNGPN